MTEFTRISRTDDGSYSNSPHYQRPPHLPAMGETP